MSLPLKTQVQDVDRETSWSAHWGTIYSQSTREKQLEEPLRELAGEGKLGSVVADLGCGNHSSFEFLGWSGSIQKFLEIDCAASPIVERRRYRMREDVMKFFDQALAISEGTLRKVCLFLGIPYGQEALREQFDSMLFLELLNYVDYADLLSRSSVLLKPGGRFVIYNKPGRGLEKFMKTGDEALECNGVLLELLKSLGFELERVQRYRPFVDDEGRDRSKILIVARKK